ncbi:K02A2.6-like [Cordylochernes scorpioides]|uniref:K02A2.6-like n=1 Tax=Cordylochernes scorpioides TaxID=51811 RepID=A0ABY6L1B5_9ARAC|nr:K02A2.6-like [Cordylochernes scorpioides]
MLARQPLSSRERLEYFFKVNNIDQNKKKAIFLTLQTPTVSKFTNRARMPGEKISTYIAELKNMAEYCKFGSALDEAIHDRLIARIDDDSIQRKLLGEGDSLTLHKAIEIALYKQQHKMQKIYKVKEIQRML